MAELDILTTWTPYLAAGLGWNFLISAIAAVLGTTLGSLFVLMKLSRLKLLRGVGAGIPTLVRGAPTLFLLFYLAIIIPNEVVLFDGGVVLSIPNWLKAALALTASPLAFTAWNLHAAIDFWRSGEKRSALLFIPNWLNGFLITFLASSGASLVGVSELVGRTNTVIKATGGSNAILLYSYAAVLFLAAALILTFLVGRLRVSVNKAVMADT
jgi:polar amino acid transport system permease protein